MTASSSADLKKPRFKILLIKILSHRRCCASIPCSTLCGGASRTAQIDSGSSRPSPGNCSGRYRAVRDVIEILTRSIDLQAFNDPADAVCKRGSAAKLRANAYDLVVDMHGRFRSPPSSSYLASSAPFKMVSTRPRTSVSWDAFPPKFSGRAPQACLARSAQGELAGRPHSGAATPDPCGQASPASARCSAWKPGPRFLPFPKGRPTSMPCSAARRAPTCSSPWLRARSGNQTLGHWQVSKVARRLYDKGAANGLVIGPGAPQAAGGCGWWHGSPQRGRCQAKPHWAAAAQRLIPPLGGSASRRPRPVAWRWRSGGRGGQRFQPQQLRFSVGPAGRRAGAVFPASVPAHPALRQLGRCPPGCAMYMEDVSPRSVIERNKTCRRRRRAPLAAQNTSFTTPDPGPLGGGPSYSSPGTRFA